VVRCVEGALACSPVTPPSAETCDLIDNDCNGLVDDGIQCASTLANVLVRATRVTPSAAPGAPLTAASGSCQATGGGSALAALVTLWAARRRTGFRLRRLLR
jgi:hypothetical protein